MCLTAAVVTATPAAAGAPSLAPITTAVLPVRLWRYANHVPLLETGDDALSCASATALRSVKWANYGLKLKLSLDEGSEHTSTGEESNNAPPGTSSEAEFDCTQGPSWQLQVQRPETQLAVHMQQLQVLLMVDVIGTNGSYLAAVIQVFTLPVSLYLQCPLRTCARLLWAATAPHWVRCSQQVSECRVLMTGTAVYVTLSVGAAGIHVALASVEKQEGALGIFRSKEEYKVSSPTLLPNCTYPQPASSSSAGWCRTSTSPRSPARSPA